MIFPDMTIEYRVGGNFDYYNKAGQRVGGGRKQADGSYNVFYKGRVRQNGFVAGTEPKKESGSVSVRSGSSGGELVVSKSNKVESLRSTVDKTTYNREGKPYYRWNSEEKSTSYIKDPIIKAEAREAKNKEWSRQKRERR